MPDDESVSDADDSEHEDDSADSAFEELIDTIEEVTGADEEVAVDDSDDDDTDEPKESEPTFDEITSTDELDLEESDSEGFDDFITPDVTEDTDVEEPTATDDEEEASPFDLEQLGDSLEEADTGEGSAFGDLLQRINQSEPEPTESEDVERHRTGQIARLEEVGALEPDSKTLLLVDQGSESEHDTCTAIMSHQPPAESNLLLVWISRKAGDRFDRLLKSWDEQPTRLGIVARSEVLGRAEEGMVWDDDTFSMNTIDDVADLTQVGITISQALSDWERSPQQTMVCIDSISDLLRHNDTERVFRFLHVLEGRLDSVDATAHFHLDSRDHDLQTIRTLQSLFDITVEVTDEGITRLE